VSTESRATPRAWSGAAIWAPLLAVVVALRSYWPWLWRRTVESGEPWGLVPLAVAIGFTAWRRKCSVERSRLAPAWLAAGGALLIGSIVSWAYLPRLASATFAALALGCALVHALPCGERPRSLGILALVFLALPIATALDLFVAFPLRATSAALGGAWLRSAGIDARRIGVGLVIAGQRTFVDPACSGVRGLWSAMVLAAALGTFRRLRWKPLAAIALAALGMATLANAVRVAALGSMLAFADREPPAWLHASVGLCAFASVAWTLTWIAERLGGDSAGPAVRSDTLHHATPPSVFQARASMLWFVSACVLASLLPAARIEPLPVYGAEPPFPGWPGEWQGAALEPRPLSWNERRYEHLLPGRSARFRLAGGAGEIVFRWVWAPTRKIHSVRWCYRNEGYALSDRPAWQDERGRTWTRFAARDTNGRSFEIREIVLAAGDATRDRSWPDAASWYWNAAFTRPSSGPWWVIAWTVPAEGSAVRGG
jgi:exosortase